MLSSPDAGDGEVSRLIIRIVSSPARGDLFTIKSGRPVRLMFWATNGARISAGYGGASVSAVFAAW